jgi:hypothetical protein
MRFGFCKILRIVTHLKICTTHAKLAYNDFCMRGANFQICKYSQNFVETNTHESFSHTCLFTSIILIFCVIIVMLESDVMWQKLLIKNKLNCISQNNFKVRFYFLFIYILRQTSTLSYLNGNKDLDPILDSLNDRNRPF